MSPRLYLVRSDMGDGGWSLHAHVIDVNSEDEGPHEAYPVLASGPGRIVRGEWAPPPQRAYARARRKARALDRATNGRVERDGGAS